MENSNVANIVDSVGGLLSGEKKPVIEHTASKDVIWLLVGFAVLNFVLNLLVKKL